MKFPSSFLFLSCLVGIAFAQQQQPQQQQPEQFKTLTVQQAEVIVNNDGIRSKFFNIIGTIGNDEDNLRRVEMVMYTGENPDIRSGVLAGFSNALLQPDTGIDDSLFYFVNKPYLVEVSDEPRPINMSKDPDNPEGQKFLNDIRRWSGNTSLEGQLSIIFVYMSGNGYAYIGKIDLPASIFRFNENGYHRTGDVNLTFRLALAR